MRRQLSTNWRQLRYNFLGRWGPWIEYFDSETNHVYYYNESTKETVWKLSSETKAKYETPELTDEGTNGDSTELPETPKRLDQGRKSITDQLESKSGKRRRSRSKSRSESRSRSRSPSRRSKRSPTPRYLRNKSEFVKTKIKGRICGRQLSFLAKMDDIYFFFRKKLDDM